MRAKGCEPYDGVLVVPTNSKWICDCIIIHELDSNHIALELQILYTLIVIKYYYYIIISDVLIEAFAGTSAILGGFDVRKKILGEYYYHVHYIIK